MIAISDVAKSARVSKATVSRVINNSPLVSEKTKRKVLAVIKKYDYRPNQAARELRTNPCKNLAIIIPEHAVKSAFSHTVNMEKVGGITSKALSEGFRINFMLKSECDNEKILDELCKNRISGVFVLYPSPSYESFIDELLKNSITPMLVNWQLPSRRVPFVMTDYQAAANMAVSYLKDKGCRNIAVMNNQLFSRRTFEEKHRNISEFTFPKWFWEYSDIRDTEALDDFIKKHNASEEKPDGIYISNNYQAVAFIEMAKKNNISIPDDLKVIALDDFPIASAITPALTCLRQQAFEIGETALSEMVNILNGDIETVQKWFLPKLIIRESA